jgi:acid stress-induced BolA-like protein IbaG/YrbA
MPKLTTSKLEQVLTQRLKLRDPKFNLEKIGSRISGSVIDNAFKRMGDHRQKKIWDALEMEFGPASMQMVGMILAYTPEEWDLPLEGKMKHRATRKAG